MIEQKKEFEKLAEKLSRIISGRVEQRVLMKRFTTFKIGGLCELMVFPKDRFELAVVVESCEKAGLPWRVLGKGSNVLVKDGGLEEVVINLQEGFNWIEAQDTTVRVGAGVKLNQLVKFCQEMGLAGLEFCAGIPGTVGGAIRMNAGAEGSEISERIVRVEFYRYPEGRYLKPKKELNFTYRSLELKAGEIIIGAEFELENDSPKAIRERIVQYLKKRRRTQPVAFASAGSIFKNPKGDYAGRIIEELGLKGLRIGDAQISDLHANFIINRGRAKAKEVMELINIIRERAKKEKGIELELEIEILGENNDTRI